MDEKKYSTSPKVSFLLGLLAGLAILGLAGFFMTLPRALSCNVSDTDKVATVDETVDTAGADDAAAVVPPADDVKPPTPPAGDPSKLVAVKDTEYVRGDKNAKVTMIEYSDFECPYCSRHNITIDKVLEEYKGKANLVFRHFPLSFHPNAQKAAEAVECAGEQNKFWEMHDIIFKANTAKQMGVEKWKTSAKELGLDTSKFDSCLDTGKYASKVKSDMASGQAAGVRGTPAVFVNGEMVSGAVPYEKFIETIDKYVK